MAGVLALAGLLTAAVAPAQAAEIRVMSGNGHTEVVQLDTLLTTPDVQTRAYVIRGEDGKAQTRTVTGVSLPAVLRAANASVDQFRAAEIQASTSSLTFSREQALNDDAWGSVDGPPVFTLTPEGYVSLLRPAVDTGDTNGSDELIATGGMVVMLRAKVQPRVTVTASETRPEVGEKVTFTANVSGVGVGEAFSVTWLFTPKGGGARKAASGEEVTHTFRKKGSYTVMATMSVPGSDDVYGSGFVDIEVGGPKEKEPEEQQKPETAASGTGGIAAGSGAGTSGSGSGTGDGTSAAGATTPPAAAVAPTATEKPERKQERKSKEPAKPKDPKIPGEVTGELLVADTTPVAAPARQSVAPAPPASEGAGGAFGLPPAAWTGIGVGVALAAGFALDRRRMGRLA